MDELAGKTAFVTGAASGIGLAMVRSFAAAGMRVVAADIEEGPLAGVRAEFSGEDVVALPVDVTDRAAMEQAASAAEAAFGKLHVLCNNAGVTIDRTVDRLVYDDWEWLLDVNLGGVVNGVQTFLPRMFAHREGGHIVNTASMAGLSAFPSLTPYTTSKYAVVGLSEAMRLDLADRNIGVSVLCPGVVSTNIGDSERNRPGGPTRSPLPAADPELSAAEQIPSELARALDPDVVGDMVRHALLHNEFYIFTHPEFLRVTDARNDEIVGAMKRWRSYVEKRVDAR